MQYLLIISHEDLFRPTENLLKNIGTWIREMEDRGIRVYGNPLQPPGTATTVRIRKGKMVVILQARNTPNNRMHADSKKRRSSFLVALLFFLPVIRADMRQSY